MKTVYNLINTRIEENNDVDKIAYLKVLGDLLSNSSRESLFADNSKI